MGGPPLHHPGLWALIILASFGLVLGAVLLHVRPSRALELYRTHVGKNVSRERLLIASAGFYVTFAIVRVITHSIRSGRGPFHDVAMGGRHIHHLVWGILLLLLVGYSWLWQVTLRLRFLNHVLALAYGVGSALTLDEFALWLNLRDVYWQREGRESIDAVLLFSALLTIGMVGAPLLRALAREAFGPARGRSYTVRT